MKPVFRVLILFLLVPVIYVFADLTSARLTLFVEQRWISHIVALICAVWAGWFVWKKSAPTERGPATSERGPASSVVYGAILGGGIGTVAGFFIPLIFPSMYPYWGSLVGIVTFGPLGLLAGAVGGFVHWRVKSKKRDA